MRKQTTICIVCSFTKCVVYVLNVALLSIFKTIQITPPPCTKQISKVDECVTVSMKGSLVRTANDRAEGAPASQACQNDAPRRAKTSFFIFEQTKITTLQSKPHASSDYFHVRNKMTRPISRLIAPLLRPAVLSSVRSLYMSE